MLDPLNSNFSSFAADSFKEWYCWVWVAIIAFLSVLYCGESEDEEENTRQSFLMRLNMPCYVYELLVGFFAPLVFKGDARFETFLVCSSSIFVLCIIGLLNPFYIMSYSYPRLEAMTPLKVSIFALFELFSYLAVAAMHLSWGYYLVNVNQYNVHYSTIDENTREKTSLFFCLVGLNPCIMICFNGILQLFCRVMKSILGCGLYTTQEGEGSLRGAYKKYKTQMQSVNKEEKRIRLRRILRTVRSISEQ